jgi:glycosyltransferase involved in cell wall biosynthesis
MQISPTVSVITITYNQEKFIRQTLDSILSQQTDFPIEILVADDASSDGTPKIVAEYANRYPQIVRPLLRKKNLGAVPNLLDAFTHARGRYVAMCEGDDYWTDNTKLQQQVNLMEANPDMALCFHPVRVFFEGGIEKDSYFPAKRIWDRSEFTAIDLLKQNFIPTNSVMYRRQPIEALRQDVMPFDWYLHLYHAKFGMIGFTKKVMAAYRRHEGGIWWDSYKNMDKLWVRYGHEHVRFFLALNALYGSDGSAADIINRALNHLLEVLLDVDRRTKTHIIQDVSAGIPEVRDEIIILQSKKIQQLEDRLVSQVAQAPASESAPQMRPLHLRSLPKAGARRLKHLAKHMLRRS